MKFSLRSLALIALVALPLAGCAGTPFGDTIRSSISLISKAQAATIEQKYLLTMIASADAVVVVGRNYVDPRRNKRCDGTNGPICRDPAITLEVNKVVMNVRKARDRAKLYLRKDPNSTAPVSVYNALKLAVASAQDVYATYGLGAK